MDQELLRKLAKGNQAAFGACYEDVEAIQHVQRLTGLLGDHP
jgi:hypothetical protein